MNSSQVIGLGAKFNHSKFWKEFVALKMSEPYETNNDLIWRSRINIYRDKRQRWTLAFSRNILPQQNPPKLWINSIRNYGITTFIILRNVLSENFIFLWIKSFNVFFVNKYDDIGGQANWYNISMMFPSQVNSFKRARVCAEVVSGAEMEVLKAWFCSR